MSKRKLTEKQARERYELLVKKVAESTYVNPFETVEDKAQRIERAKIDYAYFAKTYFSNFAEFECAEFHIKAAQMIREDKHFKGLFAWGRGLAKSTHVNILIPMWLWINGDIKVMVLVGQNKEKADILLSDLQAQFEANQLLIHDFGEQKNIGMWESGRFATRNGCAFFSLGMGQSPRGLRYRQYRPDYIVSDDLDTKGITKNPKRVEEAANWICEDLIPISDIGGSRYVQVNNVFAEKTILSHIRDTRKNFSYMRVDATDGEGNPTWYQKYTKEYYDDLRGTIGLLSFMSEFNNTPYAQGTLFTDEMIRWEALPPLRKFERIVSHWDVAYSGKGDYNAVRVWGLLNRRFYLIDCYVKQSTMAGAIRWMYEFREIAKIEGVNTPFYFESQFWNEALKLVAREIAEEMQGKGVEPLILIKRNTPKIAKFDRLMQLEPYYQHGRVVYNTNFKTKSDFIVGLNQLKGIEPGYSTHDDAPDADAEAIAMLSSYDRKMPAKYVIGQKTNRKY